MLKWLNRPLKQPQKSYTNPESYYFTPNLNIDSLDPVARELVMHVERSFNDADNKKSKVTSDILTMDGMTGIKTRHFYNNLLSANDIVYLEIGTWKGSSVCSAMCNNKATVVCIDNWSHGGWLEENVDIFNNNFTKFKGENNARFIESDCFNLDITSLPMFNVYLYDGDHTFEAQYKALTYYINNLQNTFIFIVDDWNSDIVRDGTKAAISDLNLKVLYEREVRTSSDNTHVYMPSFTEPHPSWHNGIYIAVIQKT